jgi:hypothetical protein
LSSATSHFPTSFCSRGAVWRGHRKWWWW